MKRLFYIYMMFQICVLSVNAQDEWQEYAITAQDNRSDLAVQVGEANLQNVTKLRLSGSMNSYDMMIMRNKMTNLREVDFRDVDIVTNYYQYSDGYYEEDGTFMPGGCYSEDNIFPDFLSGKPIESVVLPSSITTIGDRAFSGCTHLNSITNLTDNITEIGAHAFESCVALNSLDLPSSLISIGNYAFYGCSIQSIDLPNSIESIGDYAFSYCGISSFNVPDGITTIPEGLFSDCGNLEEVSLSPQTDQILDYAFQNCYRLKTFHLPPYLIGIGVDAFAGVPLESIYAYMPDVPGISANTFSTYQTANLYVPNFLYYNYYYDTNWSQFLSVNRCDLNPGDYEKLRTESDVIIEDDDDIIPEIEPGNPIDGEVVGGGSITVGSDDPQIFDEIEQEIGDSQSGSLIADGGDGDSNNNMQVNTLKVRINVTARRWYFFCFPFNIQEIEFSGQYKLYKYNSALRSFGMSGWEESSSTAITAYTSCAFCAATPGTLTVQFTNPTFGGHRPFSLVEYVSANVANASWNFVGNPYSCYYDFQESDFNAPITVWNGTSYQAYRPGDDDYHLRPYEAFFVQKPSDTNEIGFDKERRETYTQSLERRYYQANARRAAGIQPDRLLINLTIGDNETEMLDRTRLVLNEKASLSYEIGCDAAKFINNDAPALLYMLEGNQKMAIDERPAMGDIRLGYMTDKAGTLRISAPRMDLPMQLYDATTGLSFDLSLGSYEFKTEAGTFDKRFSLRFSDEATGIRNMTAKTGVAIGLQDGGVSIGGADGKDIDIYSANGTQMSHQMGNGFVSLPSGVYIVKVNGHTAKIHVK